MVKFTKAEIFRDVILSALIFMCLTTAIHEYFHANVTEALGGKAYVHYSWIGGYAVPSGVSGLSLILVAFSGGLGTALFYFYLQRRWLEEPNDYYFRFPCRYFMLEQLIYGIGEGLWMAKIIPNLQDWSLVASIIALMLIAFWYLTGTDQSP